MLPDDAQIRLIRDSYAEILRRRPELVVDFYTRLFVTAPEFREMFPDTVEVHAGMLQDALQIALSSTHHPEKMVKFLHELGRTHSLLGISTDQYQTFAEVLLDTLAAEADDTWTSEVSTAWILLMKFVVETMIEGTES